MPKLALIWPREGTGSQRLTPPISSVAWRPVISPHVHQDSGKCKIEQRPNMAGPSFLRIPGSPAIFKLFTPESQNAESSFDFHDGICVWVDDRTGPSLSFRSSLGYSYVVLPWCQSDSTQPQLRSRVEGLPRGSPHLALHCLQKEKVPRVPL